MDFNISKYRESKDLPKHYNMSTPLDFGKYRGFNIRKILELDPGYIKWLVETHHATFQTSIVNELQYIYGTELKTK